MALRLTHLPAAPAMDEEKHRPVLLDRLVALLRWNHPGPAVLVDATVGAGGHAEALLEASGPEVHLLGLDRDPHALALAGARLADHADRVHLAHAPYDDLSTRAAGLVAGIGPVVGVLFDLGVSSMQLDRGERGFSFRTDAPLDMRMDPTAGPTAAELVNHASEGELAGWIARFGEDRHARRIARAIVRARPLATTTDLAAVVAEAVPAAARRGIHPATRTFQALRIVVNEELDRFSASLPQALELLAPPAPAAAPASSAATRGGRIAVLGYHSLEDRIAKRALTKATTGCICPPDLPVCGCGRTAAFRLVTKGAERPLEDEITANPRARSARLRAAERIAIDPPNSQES